MRTFLFLFLFLILASCAKNESELASDAIDIALTHLSKNECDNALEVLLDVHDQGDNPIYLQVLASAYACKSSFDEISFIEDDLSSLDTTNVKTIMKTASIMTLSPQTSADSAEYTYILSGINTLLSSTTGSPSQTARDTAFGVRRSGDMAMQALFLNLVNLGKFLNFYGNVSATGVKGGGSNTNSCFINYTDGRAVAVLGAQTGACTVANDGHPDLSMAAGTLANTKRRLCEGLVLFTNILDILNNITLPASSDLSSLSTIATKINTIKASATAAGLGTLINTTSQSSCETLMNTPSNLNDMEYLYALVFEAGLQ